MSIVMLLMCCGLVGCDSMIVLQFESDWRFKYYYDETRDGYIIVGTELFGYSDPMYVPAYYKGKPIVGTSYWKIGYIGSAGVSYHIDYGDVKKVYFPFGITRIKVIDDKEVYIPITEVRLDSGSDWSLRESEETTITYMPPKSCDSLLRCIKEINEHNHKNNIKEEFAYQDYGHYFKSQEWEDVETGSPMIIVRKANTSYMFNYEDAPNNNYFFINNFENGALIENTPYEPLREGYKFDGWYKEPECINKCNFGVDTYVEQYDENGELIFNELKLYAKWREKNFLGF